MAKTYTQTLGDNVCKALLNFYAMACLCKP